MVEELVRWWKSLEGGGRFERVVEGLVEWWKSW